MRFFLTALLLLAGVSAEAQTGPRCFGTGDVVSADGAYTARITRTGRSTCGESKIEIFTADGHLMIVADYTSNDGQGGMGVIQAQWSPDSQFLVFSLTQPPGRADRPYTLGIYSSKKNKVKALPASKPEFTFSADALEISGITGQVERLPLKE
jgi:hypothetical protein